MARKKTAQRQAATNHTSCKFRKIEEAQEAADPQVHIYGEEIICDTDSRGYPTPGNMNPAELVIHQSEGAIPLWAEDVTLRWRFQARSMELFVDPAAAADELRSLLGGAILEWGDAAPVRFSESSDVWDFEISIRENDRCRPNGCVLASAFFPDAGRHELVLYPRFLEQDRDSQISTLAHELGHIFGLRHFFAQIRETEWPSEVFGTHSRFTIMNYGADSIMTETDRSDLRSLYQLAWSGEMTEINGTPVVLKIPYHMTLWNTHRIWNAQPSGVLDEGLNPCRE